MIKLFVFDLGNVILPFEHHQIADKLYATSVIKDHCTPDEIFRFLFDNQKGFINDYETGRLSTRGFFEGVKRKYKLDLEQDAFKDIWNHIFREDPAVSEVILYLKSKGFPILLLSNTNEMHFSYIMEEYPIIHHFDEWILSFEAGAKKPHQKIYDMIFERRSLERHEAFYIDDVPEYIEAAAGYGIPGVVFREASDIWKIINENCL